jgi:formate hydrogenlyase subunit 3/multisubunit Na+/H+ antiporter MnhD subunit
VVELAFGLPAVGAVVVSLFRRRRGLAVVAGLAFGLAGLVATSLAVPGRQDRLLGLDAMLLAPEQVILVATFVAGGLAVVLVPPGADRVPMLVSVLAGLSAIAAVAILTQPLVVALVVLVLAAVQSAVPALRSFSDRVRAPAFGALLIALGALLADGALSPSLVRVAGLALVVGVGATIGVAPYLQGLDPREPAPASPIAWLGFFGPALAVVLVTRFVGLLPAESGSGYLVLLALGIFNLGLGTFGAWQSKANADLWRYSFISDWGLVLVGFGLLNQIAVGGAYLLLLSILLLRLPLYLLARPALIQGQPVPTITPLTLLVAAALFGSAPFAGFPARLLIIRGATQVPWPLTVLLVLVMLSWLPQSLRLAQTLGRPAGRLAAGVVVVLFLNLALGLYPNLVLNLLGVR